MDDLIDLGWVPLGEDGKPHRPQASNKYNRMFDSSRPAYTAKPPRIYTTEARAAAQSPVKKAAPVYMKEPT